MHPREWSKAFSATMVLTAVALAGCSDDGGQDPFNPPGQTDETPGSTIPNGGPTNVPKVTNPLNVEPFLTRPCDLVDDKTVAEVGDMDPPEQDVDSERAKRLIGPNCTWIAKERGPDIGLEIHTVHRDKAEEGLKGIGGVYAGYEGGVLDYLTPVEIPGHPGYPAVFAGKNSDKELGVCPLSLGVADDLAIAMRVTNPDDPSQDTCPATLKVAASVLQTLKTGN